MLVKISDEQPVAIPYVDASGVQYPANIEALWSDEQLAAIGLERVTPAPVFDPNAVKAECRRRILASIKETAQTNAVAARAAGWPMAPDETVRAQWDGAFTAGVQWIWDMRAICATLIAAQDMSYAQDAHWPACPASASALAALF